MFELIIGLAVFAVIFYYYGIKPMSYWREKGVKQKKKIWILGDNVRNVFKKESVAEMVERLYNDFKKERYFGTYQFTTPVLLIKDLDLIKQICIKDFEHFTDHNTLISGDADPLFGKNLFALKGENWRNMRSILSPSFTGSKMKIIFTFISECAENFTKHFLKKNQEIVEVEMKDIFTRFTNDVIATTAFGITTNSLDEPNNEFYLMGKEATDSGGFIKRMKFFAILLAPKLFNFLKISIMGKKVGDFFINLIENNIKTRKEKGIVRPDMIHLLLEAQKNLEIKEEKEIVDNGFATVEETDIGKQGTIEKRTLTNLDICSQALIFFFAGFDTVSTVMCFLSHELAINPDIQNRLREEITNTLEECNGNLTYEALLKMQYLDMVVSETLRKWPSAVATDRVCTKPYLIKPEKPDESAIKLEEGTLLMFPIFGLHYDPEYFPDPKRFDPERFNSENKHKIKPYSYIPFGMGPRNCIGNRFALLEIKVIIFHLLSKFELVPTVKTQIPIQLSKKQFNLTAENGFHLGLKRLNK